jgi:pyruvate carboxylase
MSGMTAQPSLGALVTALQNTPLQVNMDDEELQPYSDYW